MKKMYVIGVDHKSRKLVLKVYSARDIQNEKNPDGLTYEGIVGADMSVMYVGDRKCDCMTYIIKNNLEDYKILDDTDRILVKGYKYVEAID